MIPRLKTLYEKDIIKNLMTKLNYKNKHQAPKLVKIVLNMGLGEDANDTKKLNTSLEDLSSIAGQKPVITKFKKSISNFKTRKGANAGAKVTLRSGKMYEFIDRLVNIALPRIKDFRGLSSKGFDKFGNNQFDLVITDVEMPRMNGFELTKKIRTESEHKTIPIIVVTSLASLEDRKRGVEVGASAYFVKSNFEKSNLLDMVKRLV